MGEVPEWRQERVHGLKMEIKAKVISESWFEVLQLSEELEMIYEACKVESAAPWTNDMAVFASIHLIALCITDNLCEAKFRWKRIPDDVAFKRDPFSEVG